MKEFLIIIHIICFTLWITLHLNHVPLVLQSPELIKCKQRMPEMFSSALFSEEFQILHTSSICTARNLCHLLCCWFYSGNHSDDKYNEHNIPFLIQTKCDHILDFCMNQTDSLTCMNRLTPRWFLQLNVNKDITRCRATIRPHGADVNDFSMQ